ncbi:uncharacterized protein Dvar_68430 [Desulfosarcina variabilis str. Montpellier]
MKTFETHIVAHRNTMSTDYQKIDYFYENMEITSNFPNY